MQVMITLTQRSLKKRIERRKRLLLLPGNYNVPALYNTHYCINSRRPERKHGPWAPAQTPLPPSVCTQCPIKCTNILASSSFAAAHGNLTCGFKKDSKF